MTTDRPSTTQRRARATRTAAAGRSVQLALALLATAALAGCGARGVRLRNDPTAQPQVARLTENQKQLREAGDQAALAPAEPYWVFREGQLLAEADSLARAEAALRSCLRRDPSYAPALSLISKLFYDAGRHAEGVALLEEALGRAGAFPEGAPGALLAGLALHHEAMGRHDLAAAVVTGSTPAGRGRANAALVYVTLRGEDRAAAADLARAALDDQPRSAANHNNYGITRLRAGDPKSARQAFLRAIELEPALPGPYYNLAILERFYLFDEVAAARWIEAYRERSSEDPDGLFRPVVKDETRPVAEKGR